MKFEIKLNDHPKLPASAISCERQKDTTVFSVDCDGQTFLHYLGNAHAFEIQCYYADKHYGGFYCEPSSVELTGSGIRFSLDFKLPDIFYDQRVLQTLVNWDNGIVKDFYCLPVIKKKAWLRACLIYSGLPFAVDKQQIKIDCSPVNDRYDLFYLLGESFIGPRGYFGQDFHGVFDCLLNFKETGHRKITFTHTNRLLPVFDTSGISKEEFFGKLARLGVISVE